MKCFEQRELLAESLVPKYRVEFEWCAYSPAELDYNLLSFAVVVAALNDRLSSERDSSLYLYALVKLVRCSFLGPLAYSEGDKCWSAIQF